MASWWRAVVSLCGDTLSGKGAGNVEEMRKKETMGKGGGAGAVDYASVHP